MSLPSTNEIEMRATVMIMRRRRAWLVEREKERERIWSAGKKKIKMKTK